MCKWKRAIERAAADRERKLSGTRVGREKGIIMRSDRERKKYEE